MSTQPFHAITIICLSVIGLQYVVNSSVFIGLRPCFVRSFFLLHILNIIFSITFVLFLHPFRTLLSRSFLSVKDNYLFCIIFFPLLSLLFCMYFIFCILSAVFHLGVYKYFSGFSGLSSAK